MKKIAHMWTEPNNIFGEIVIVAQFENVIYRKHRTPLNIREDCKSKEGDQHYVILSIIAPLIFEYKCYVISHQYQRGVASRLEEALGPSMTFGA